MLLYTKEIDSNSWVQGHYFLYKSDWYRRRSDLHPIYLESISMFSTICRSLNRRPSQNESHRTNLTQTESHRPSWLRRHGYTDLWGNQLSSIFAPRMAICGLKSRDGFCQSNSNAYLLRRRCCWKICSVCTIKYSLMGRNDHTTMTAPLPVCSAKLSIVESG